MVGVEDPKRYGASFADVYDDWYGDLEPVGPIVESLAAAAPGPRLLELGSGTGRLAAPLAAAGFEVIALDASATMLGLMTDQRSSPVVGDMAALPVRAATVDVALIAFNTIFNLTTPEQQAQCFVDIATVLRPGGRLFVDAMVPADPPPTRQHHVAPAVSARRADQSVLIATRQDGRSRLIDGAHVQFTATGVVSRPWRILTTTPAELDRHAANAGLGLAAAWQDWIRLPSTPDAGRRVAIYERPLQT